MVQQAFFITILLRFRKKLGSTLYPGKHPSTQVSTTRRRTLILYWSGSPTGFLLFGTKYDCTVAFYSSEKFFNKSCHSLSFVPLFICWKERGKIGSSHFIETLSFYGYFSTIHKWNHVFFRWCKLFFDSPLSILHRCVEISVPQGTGALPQNR